MLTAAQLNVAEAVAAFGGIAGEANAELLRTMLQEVLCLDP
jgi:hypothetical protein